MDFIGEFKRESRRASTVLADVAAIQKDIGDALHAVEFDEEAFRRPFHWDEKIILVVGRSFEEVSATARIGIPCMGQSDVASIVAAVLRLEVEAPSLVDGKDDAGMCRRAQPQEQNCRKIPFHSSVISVRDKDTKNIKKTARL